MKKQLSYWLISLSILIVSCDPITDKQSLGSVISPDELQLEVYTTTDGGNQVIMSNTTPQVGSYWDYVINISTRQRDTVIFPFLGEQTISFTGICNGGTVTTTRKVNINKIDHEVAKEWAYFAGTGAEGKTWVWNYDETSEIIWGNGGYLNDIAPAWWGLSADDMNRDFADEFVQTMTFDLNGGANFTRKEADGSVVQKGTFNFDLSKSKPNVENTGTWSLGRLQLVNATVIHGISPNEGNAPVHNYDIVKLTDEEMVLAYPEPGVGAYGGCWYWKFKIK